MRKITFAKQLMEESPELQFTYIDCEHPRDLAKLADPVLYFESNMERCVVIDEIQVKPEFFPVLRSLIDKKRSPCRFIILGSASPKLIRDSSESLAGRISYTELCPLNILEINDRIS